MADDGARVFAFVRGTLLERPPYESPHELVLAWGSNPVNGQIRDVISGSNFVDLSERTTTLSAMAAFHGDEVVVMKDSRPKRWNSYTIPIPIIFLNHARAESLSRS